MTISNFISQDYFQSSLKNNEIIENYKFFYSESGLSYEKKESIRKRFRSQIWDTKYFEEDYNISQFKALPHYSWHLKLDIELEEKFMSRGDNDFYLFENSISRDMASGKPIIKSTTWKGNFLDALYTWRIGLEKNVFQDWNWKQQEQLLCIGLSGKLPNIVLSIIKKHESLKKCPIYAIEEIYNLITKDKDFMNNWLDLHNNEKNQKYMNHPLTIIHKMRGTAFSIFNRLCGADDNIYHLHSKTENLKKQYHIPDSKHISDKHESSTGCLYFSSSYFNKIAFDIVAPVKRESRTVDKPISMEVIPQGSKSMFVLHYLPPCDIDYSQLLMDLEISCSAIYTMMYDSGFSAKKGVGYGQAKVLSGNIDINLPQGKEKDFLKDYNSIVKKYFKIKCNSK